MVDEKLVNAEMLVHVALCTHKEPKDVLILGSNDTIAKEVAKYEALHVELSDKLSFIESVKNCSFDVVIATSVRLYDLTFIAQINRVLKDEGLVVLRTDENYKENLKNLSSFNIAMLYRFEGKKAILASKKYHPTADLILQRSDLLEEAEYYNSEIHQSVFAQPNFLRRELLGIQKN